MDNKRAIGEARDYSRLRIGGGRGGRERDDEGSKVQSGIKMVESERDHSSVQTQCVKEAL